jgi:hypothetical protein
MYLFIVSTLAGLIGPIKSRPHFIKGSFRSVVTNLAIPYFKNNNNHLAILPNTYGLLTKYTRTIWLNKKQICFPIKKCLSLCFAKTFAKASFLVVI